MTQNLNLDITLTSWAEIVIKNWRRKITELKIGSSGQLFDSFVHTVIHDSGGKPERISFMFNYYGKFVDMGVGKEMKLGNPGDVKTTRKPKRWYSSVFYSQTIKLREILAEKYGIIGAAVIVENIMEGERKSRKPSGGDVKTRSSGSGSYQYPAQRPITDLDREWMRRNGLL